VADGLVVGVGWTVADGAVEIAGGASVDGPLRLHRPDAYRLPSANAAKAPLTRPTTTPTQMIMATVAMSTRFIPALTFLGFR
jgi:hypothetical protein